MQDDDYIQDEMPNFENMCSVCPHCWNCILANAKDYRAAWRYDWQYYRSAGDELGDYGQPIRLLLPGSRLPCMPDHPMYKHWVATAGAGRPSNGEQNIK